MIFHHECRFKLIMAKAKMPGMDALSFLDIVLEKDIPVIFIYSGGFDDVTQKALATGLCYFLKEPICANDLKYLWQHVYHSRAHSAKKIQNAYFQNTKYHAKGLENMKMKQVLRGNGERNKDGNEDMAKKKKIVDENTEHGSLRSTQMEFNNSYYSSEEKRAIVWTPELHLKFTEAIHMLGGENRARPKQILSHMNEPLLTVRQVASHLQKHQLRLKRKENARNSDLPLVSTSSSLSRKAKFFSPSQVTNFGTKGLPPPKVSLNESHSQNQKFLVNNAATENNVCLSQRLDSTVAHPVLAASVDQNHPETEYHDFIKKFVENCDNFDLSKNEINPGDVDRYCEMLRAILDGNNSTPWEFDMDNTNIRID
ncbi:two-component response regulator ORR26 [Cajanus cajan]|uniref:two-component response regulator ORR26 n=1 Tax=Cajanus cajan TaxID=3821 RepID=UPI00098DC3EE|nr:two-component response regulator ORR26 [Cajanus cajan]